MPAEQYWYNITTGRVERGRESGWQDLIGPYDSHEEALQALEQAKRRNEDWEAEDQKWEK